ncbi:MAG: deoxyribonuclease V [Candidatus Altiarchaeota archaeon]|nr:deoxyribonuclease V [Candidatus Altiarchaeota archaeon]
MDDTEKYVGIQEELRKKVLVEDQLPGEIKTVAGVDQSFQGEKVISCIVVLEYPDMRSMEKKYAAMEVDFPYIPGLLAFREGPSILRAYGKLMNKPDILLVDGQGIAHPRGVGLASHIGVVLDKPTIGVAKSRLVGEYEVPKEVGGCSELRYNGEVVGFVLKSKRNCNPLFISPGHRISPEKSLEVVKNCLRDHKLPEPTRLAHMFVNMHK